MKDNDVSQREHGHYDEWEYELDPLVKMALSFPHSYEEFEYEEKGRFNHIQMI